MELKDRVEKYIAIEEEALQKLKIAVPENSLMGDYARNALEMIIGYFNDAKHFKEKGDFLNSFAALNYSYGWIDSLVRLGIFDGKEDHRLFTLFK